MTENDKNGSASPQRERDPLGGGLTEMPPNIPPGFLGEKAPDMKKVDGDGSHGLNAGVIQEWTWETTIIIVIMTYIFFFPAAYVILWRSNKVPRNHKLAITAAMTAGLVYVAGRLLGLY